MTIHRVLTRALVTIGTAMSAATAALAVSPIDEETMARFEAIHDSVARHQHVLEETSEALSRERERVAGRLTGIEEEMAQLHRSTPYEVPSTERERAEQARALSEKRIEVKSRYLEALGEQHAIDVELIRSFTENGSVILRDLERYVAGLDDAVEARNEYTESGQSAVRALQLGTARALAAIEDWGHMTRDDPRFRSLYATARMLNRAQRALESTTGTGATASAVKAQVVHVRALLDQSRIALALLDHEGLILQVAAQNLTVRLLDGRMGNIGITGLPTEDFEKRLDRITSRILVDEDPIDRAGGDTLLNGFDECARLGVCD